MSSAMAPPTAPASRTKKIGELLASAKRARSHKHLVERTSNGDVKSSETRYAPPTSGALSSRASGRLSSTYIYFLVLEGSWLRCLVLASFVYGIAICFCSVIASPLDLVNANEELELLAGQEIIPQIELALRFGAAHVVTMSAGSIVPVTSTGYLIAVLQQLIGVAVNLLVLSAIVAKFQSPKADIVFSSNGVVRCRDGVPTVQLRVGNLRCNKLFPDSITLTLLRRHRTEEGEVYSKRTDLSVGKPSTISGVFTVVHVIDESSPLLELLESGALANSFEKKETTTRYDSTQQPSETMLLHATLRAYDDVFKGDVCATATYGGGDLVFGGAFADVISVGKNGSPVINWERFDDVEESVCGAALQYVTVEMSDSAVDPEQQVLTQDAEPSSPPTNNSPRLSCGCARASYGDVNGLDNTSQLSPLVPYCPYSSRLGLLLAEAGVTWELTRIDYVSGPTEWYKKAFPPADAPAMQGTPGGSTEDCTKWIGGSNECRANAIAASARVAKASVSRATIAEQEITKLAESMIFGGLAPRMVGTKETRGGKILAFMLKKTLGTEEAERILSGESDEESIKQLCRDAMRDAIVTTSKLLEQCEEKSHGGFLAPGGTPDPSDFTLGGAVAVAKSLLESGLADIHGGTDGFQAFQAQAIDRYLDRWTERASWQKTYGPYGSVNTCNAVIVRSFAAKIAGAASDVCLLQSVRGACNRARHIDVVYRKWINTVARGHERSVTHGQRNGHVNGRNSVREERNDEGFMSASICI